MRAKKCKSCERSFTPQKPMQAVCSPRCAIDHAKEKERKAKKRETRQRKRELKTKGELLKEAQTEFNRYIRLRDKHEPCISCGRHHSGQYHAGHYRTVGAHPELRFEELNCHKQCAPCNNHKSGNIVEYRINLAAKIGAENLDWLEGPHEPKNYTREEIMEIKKTYRQKAKAMENA